MKTNEISDDKLEKISGGKNHNNIECKGRVIEKDDVKGIYVVKLTDEQKINVYLSSNIRRKNMNIFVGDEVIVELSPNDFKQGVIIDVYK